MLPVLAILGACQGQGGTGFKGTIQNASNQEVILEQAHFDRSNIALGRATCDANGKFDIKLEKPFEEGLYRMSIGAKRMYFILGGKESSVDISGDLATIDRLDVQVTGSETFNCYAGIIRDLLKNQLKSPDEAKVVIQSAQGCEASGLITPASSLSISHKIPSSIRGHSRRRTRRRPLRQLGWLMATSVPRRGSTAS